MSLLWLSLGLDNNQWGHERGLCGAGIVCLLILVLVAQVDGIILKIYQTVQLRMVHFSVFNN